MKLYRNRKDGRIIMGSVIDMSKPRVIVVDRIEVNGSMLPAFSQLEFEAEYDLLTDLKMTLFERDKLKTLSAELENNRTVFTETRSKLFAEIKALKDQIAYLEREKETLKKQMIQDSTRYIAEMRERAIEFTELKNLAAKERNRAEKLAEEIARLKADKKQRITRFEKERQAAAEIEYLPFDLNTWKANENLKIYNSLGHSIRIERNWLGFIILNTVTCAASITDEEHINSDGFFFRKIKGEYEVKDTPDTAAPVEIEIDR
jgi:hypothetical protein